MVILWPLEQNSRLRDSYRRGWSYSLWQLAHNRCQSVRSRKYLPLMLDQWNVLELLEFLPHFEHSFGEPRCA